MHKSFHSTENALYGCYCMYERNEYIGVHFLDKGVQFWRTKRDGSLVSNYPARIQNFWMGLPPETNKVDAVYERKSDSRIIFFIGESQNSKVNLI